MDQNAEQQIKAYLADEEKLMNDWLKDFISMTRWLAYRTRPWRNTSMRSPC